LFGYLWHARPAAWASALFLCACAIPLALADAFVSLYQANCFPLCGIPLVRRADYFIYDRSHLGYLNAIEAGNCLYCSYATGLFAYLGEIAAQTEQHWCPIKHAQRVRAPHSRYAKFVEYGDQAAYRRHLQQLSSDYADIQARAGQDTK